MHEANGDLVLPGLLADADLSTLGVVSSVTGFEYEMYDGLVAPYENQFSILVQGEITTDVAEEVFEAIRNTWQQTLVGESEL